MPFLQTLLYSLLLSSITFAKVNGPCSANGTPGVCLPTSQCKGSGESVHSNFCPDDPADVKCCTKPSCGTGGNCRFTNQCSGSSKTGLCPGPAEFQCCLGGGSGGKSSDEHDLSAHGVSFIAGFEGWSANFYRDNAKVKTIGYGHACQPDSACDDIKAPISKKTGQALLRKDADRFVQCVNKQITAILTQNQFDALVSFAFNLGCGNLEDLKPNLNSHHFAAATKQMMEYVHAGGVVLKGLVRRRQAEVDLFNS